MDERRARLLGMLDPDEMRAALGRLLETHPEVFDEIMVAVPQSWHADEQPDPPDTIEAVVAASIEHHGRYRSELRHLPAEG